MNNHLKNVESTSSNISRSKASFTQIHFNSKMQTYITITCLFWLRLHKDVSCTSIVHLDTMKFISHVTRMWSDKESDRLLTCIMTYFWQRHEMMRTASLKKDFVWTDDEVELLPTVTHEYNMQKLMETVNWESISASMTTFSRSWGRNCTYQRLKKRQRAPKRNIPIPRRKSPKPSWRLNWRVYILNSHKL